MLMLVQASRRMPSKVLSCLHGSYHASLHMCFTCTHTYMLYDGSTRTQHEHGHKTTTMMMMMTACTKTAMRYALHMGDRQGNVGKVGSFRPVSNEREDGGMGGIHVCVARKLWRLRSSEQDLLERGFCSTKGKLRQESRKPRVGSRRKLTDRALLLVTSERRRTNTETVFVQRKIEWGKRARIG